MARFVKLKIALVASCMLAILICVAVLAPFFANNKPIICKINNEIKMPIIKAFCVKIGMAKWDKNEHNLNWKTQTYQWKIFPPVPYAPEEIEYNASFIPPFTSNHYLGTDQLGRDVTAGIIHGSRVAIFVGLFSTSIAFLIGIFVGLVAGYFGNTRFKVHLFQFILFILLSFYFIFYATVLIRQYLYTQSFPFAESLLVLALGIFIYISLRLLGKQISFLQKEIAIPFDLLVLKTIEITNSIPRLILIIAVSLVFKATMLNFAIIIALLSWNTIARFTRAEVLKIKELNYVESAYLAGYSTFTILWKHILPNALNPIIISFSFIVANTIFIESTLSFLGIKLDDNLITWGYLLRLARETTSAWWLAVFPGLAIFVTITCLNIVGEAISEILNPKN